MPFNVRSPVAVRSSRRCKGGVLLACAEPDCTFKFTFAVLLLLVLSIQVSDSLPTQRQCSAIRITGSASISTSTSTGTGSWQTRSPAITSQLPLANYQPTVTNQRMAPSGDKLVAVRSNRVEPMTAATRLYAVRQKLALDSDSIVSEGLMSPIFSMASGVLGLILLLINRLMIPIEQVTTLQSRSDIIALIGCSAVILNGLSAQEIAVRERPAVGLVGYSLAAPALSPVLANDSDRRMVEWAVKTALTTTPAKSVHFIRRNQVLARGGIISLSDNIQVSSIDAANMPILSKATEGGTEVYLPDLQILPGKVEFLPWLPINAQSLFIVPMGPQGAMLISTSKAKELNRSDQQKLRSLAQILACGLLD